jgi:hypothetical protein
MTYRNIIEIVHLEECNESIASEVTRYTVNVEWETEVCIMGFIMYDVLM